MDLSIKAIDCVVNPITPEIMATRPAWSKTFWTQKNGRKPEDLVGLTHDKMIAAMDAAGIEKSFLLAVKIGCQGLPGSWHLPYEVVADAVQKYPDRFYGLAGIDPTQGMQGVRDFERSVREYGFIGAHGYPHWFDLAPDHPRWYPFYAKCCELDVPIQLQVGQSLNYTSEQRLPSVGRPITLDAVA